MCVCVLMLLHMFYFFIYFSFSYVLFFFFSLSQAFAALLGVLQGVPSLWALNLCGIAFSDTQLEHLLAALAHSRVSHLALPGAAGCARWRFFFRKKKYM
jgi:hypothetical protein